MSEPDYKDNLFFEPQTEWKGTALDALGKGHATFSYRLLQSKIEENEKLKDENTKLKELLKECRDIFDECFSPSVKKGKLWQEIDEVQDDKD